MESPFLLVMAALNLAAAAFFAFTARSITKRPVSHHARLAGNAFTLSWAMLALMAACDAARLVVAWAPGTDIAVYATLARFKILMTGMMIAGFGYYVAYLWTGKKAVGIPVLLFALSHALLFLYLMDRRSPLEVVRGEWGAVMIFENPPLLFGESNLVMYFYFFAPPILLALAFASLWFLFSDPLQRRRVLVTALAIFSFQATGFLLFSPRVDLDHVANPLALAVVVAIAGAAWWAYSRAGSVPDKRPDEARARIVFRQ